MSSNILATMRPDPDTIFPVSECETAPYIKPTIRNPDIVVSDFTYSGGTDFEKAAIRNFKPLHFRVAPPRRDFKAQPTIRFSGDGSKSLPCEETSLEENDTFPDYDSPLELAEKKRVTATATLFDKRIRADYFI